MKTHIQIKLQSKTAIDFVSKLGKNKRLFVEQAIIEYIKKLEEEGNVDIFIEETIKNHKESKKEDKVVNDVSVKKEDKKYKFDF